MNEALADARTAFNQAGRAALDHNGDLDLTSKSGRSATTTLIGVSQAVRTVAADLREAGASEDVANAKLMEGRATFLKLAAAAGLSAQKARLLADALGLVPPRTDANVVVRGASEGTTRVRNLIGALAALHSKNIYVRTYTQQVVVGDSRVKGGSGNTLGGVLPRRAGGGEVRKGHAYLVGEQGTEIMFAPSDGYVIPAGPTASLRAGHGTPADVVGRFGGTPTWTGGAMAASTGGSGGGGGGSVTATLSPQDRALLRAIADRPVDARLSVDSEIVARANDKGQRRAAQKG
jgi:hypothetical protein